jgi:hypothetical protein
MRVLQLAAVAASLASFGHAFLLPPTITSHHAKAKAIPMPQILAEKQVIEIPCFGCPVLGMTKAASAETKNFLRFNLSIAHNADADAFLLNQHQVYPYDPLAPSFLLGHLSAEQFVSSPAGTWAYAGTPELQYKLNVHTAGEASALQELGLVSIRLEVSAIDGSPIIGYPAIAVKLLETPSGGLMIGDIQLSPTRSTHATPGSECKSMLCSLKAYLGAKLSKLGGCAGMRRPHHGQEGVKSADHDDFHHHRPGHDRRPHHSFPFRPHRHHHKHNGFTRALRFAVWSVLIPALVGCVVGAAIVTLLYVAVNIYGFFFCRRATRTLEDGVSDDEGDDETKSFIHHQDAPPVYEEAPIYQESVANAKASE